MEKIKNWLLPIVLFLAGVGEAGFALFDELVVAEGLPASYSKWLRIICYICAGIILKQQPSSLKKHRQIKQQTKQ